MKKGMRLYIENIKCKNADGMIKELGSITIKIISGLQPSRADFKLSDPFLIASISGIYGLGVLRITKNDLVNAKGVELADPASKIIGFSLYCDCGGTTWVEYSTSDQFTPKMKKLLSKVRKGCELKVQQIRYSTEAGSVKNYGNLIFAVVK